MMPTTTRYRIRFSLLVLLLLLFGCHVTANVADRTSQTNLIDLEDALLKIPNPDRLRSVLRHLTQRSHVAATKGDWDNAVYVRDKLRQYGIFNAKIDPVKVMMTYPLSRPQLTAHFDTGDYHAKLSEDIVTTDTTSSTTKWRNHTFLAYSPSGKVTASLVYANYGRPEDFELLHSMGVSVKNCIVIMRYGECFRGLKIMNAEKRGAIGSIIYSDPQQDGYSQGPTYPKGPWRPPSGVQRGSVQHISKCAGDPWRLYLNSSNGFKSVKNWCGYNTHDMIPKHVALPLSYQDAQPLLEQIGGKKAPKSFQGGLPFRYHVGPSTFQVTMKTNHTFEPRLIPNVIATIPGKSRKGAIILGNHRDAWVFGAVDPNSGTTALLEVARSLMELKKNYKWQPKRDIVLTSWSGEEYGLLGSTAWAELNADTLRESAAVYLNVDCAVTGNVSLNVSATHSLTTLVQQSARRVPAPPVHASWKSQSMASPKVWSGKVDTLGSGSDYTAFLDRLGIVSLDMSFRGSYGVYHSVYDSMSWMEQQGDPTFEIHQSMTQLWALMTFRLASYAVLPIDLIPQAQRLEHSLQTTLKWVQANFPHDVTPEKVERLGKACRCFQMAAKAINDERNNQHLKNTTDLNRRVMLTERKFLGPGLPKRPWFRHILQAPGFDLGYGSLALPGIAQAVYDKNATLALQEIQVAATSIEQAANFLKGEASGYWCHKPGKNLTSLMFDVVYDHADHIEMKTTGNQHKP